MIGQVGVEAREDIEEADDLENVVPIKKDYKVDIEIQSGLGYTDQGKKAAMLELANFILAMTKEGVMPPEAIKVIVKRMVEVYKFGPTGEIMEALDALGQEQLDEQQLKQIKLAVIEVLKDAKQAGLFDPDEDKHLNISKMGAIQAISDAKKAGMWEEKQQSQLQEREIEKIEKIETGKDGQKTTKQVKTKMKG